MKRATISIRRRALSLIELLVVLSIIALLVAILQPSLTAAREQARIAKCLSNLRSSIQFTHMYMDSDWNKVIEWYKYPAIPGFGVTLYTNAVFGGFQAPIGIVDDGLSSDAERYPAQVRPLNSIASPMARGQTILDIYKCPSDRGHYRSTVGSSSSSNYVDEDVLTAWEQIGTSYVLNTHFMQGYVWSTPGSGGFDIADTGQYAQKIATQLVGGKASRFIMWLEDRFYGLTYGARPTLALSNAPQQRLGWHRQFSKHSAAFYDGHAEYRFFNTRLSVDDGWTLWEPK